MGLSEKLITKIKNENIIKNIIIIIFAFLLYPTIKESLSTLKADNIGDFLLVISILLVTVCFANFAFSYEYSQVKKTSLRLISHSATFIFLLLIALLLEAMTVSIGIIYPSLFNMIMIFSILLYLGVVLYDFWDLFRRFE